MNCNQLIDDEQILEAYSIANIMAKFRINSYGKNPQCLDNTHKDALLYLLKDDEEILEHCCIHNEFLILNNQKIVKLNNITIKEELRKKKIMKNILHKNKEVYKQNGFELITLKAIRDGVITWKKLGFEFDNITDEKIILKQFKIYLRKVKGISDKKFVTIQEIPSRLFFDETISFTQWLSSKNNANFQHFSMTLRILDDR